MGHTSLKSWGFLGGGLGVSQELKPHLTPDYLTADTLLKGFMWVLFIFIPKSSPKKPQSIA